MTIFVAVRHRFGAFSLDVEFAIERPGITALFGASGAGKTTVAAAIGGLFRPAWGRVTIGKRVVFDSQSGLFVPPRARRIGYVFQEARLFPHMSVEKNLRFGWRRAANRASESQFDRVVALLGLEEVLHRKPARLSGGERSRTALGRALLSAPELLVLDEPLASLDPARKAEILPWLERLRDEASLPMIYVTHALEEVARLADTVIVLRDGRRIAEGPTFDLLPDLEFSTLARTAPAGAVFPATIVAHHDADELTELSFAGGTLFVSRLERLVGTLVRVRFRAEDVMLARVAPEAISANNILSAMVAAVRLTDNANADVQLACGGVKIVSRITRASLARLGIEPGMPVFAIVKSATVDSR